MNRIFMEYIDNAIDSAEEFYNGRENGYSRPIEITLTIEGENYRSGKVTIADNCFGITNFTKIVNSVGYSDKGEHKAEKAQPWINGQFGYGIYSFMAACSRMEITSKTKSGKALYIPIESQQFDAKRIEDVVFPDPKEIKNFRYESGSSICLSHFEKHSWKQIDADELKNEIEKHFELLLARKNLTIRLIHKISSLPEKTKALVCEPFDYSKYEGIDYKKDKKELRYISGRKHKRLIKLPIEKPIHIFLKITRGIVINKRPVFISKGRRIGEIKDIKSFKSSHKGDIWDHPNVTGFIDLSDFLDPTMARNDFKNNDRSRALFSFLLELEPEILDVIKDVNKKSEERHYQELEDRLNQVLSKLAKIDKLNFRTDYLSGNSINLEKGGTGQSIENGGGSKDRGENGQGLNGEGLGENEGDGLGAGGHIGDIPGGELGGERALNKEPKNPFEDTGFKGDEKKKSGFNIRIEPVREQRDANNELFRSQLAGNEIIIFQKHPDFQERVDVSRKKEPKITQRLITYLAGEITVHYKDKVHTKHKAQPEYNINMFSDLVSFIYQFETMLQDLAGKNLSDVNK